MGLIVRNEIPFGKYVVDIYLPEVHLALEADGEQHGYKRDAERDAYFYAVWGVLGNLFPSINLEEWIFFQMKMLADRKKEE